jgi:hypothetical protein
MSKKQRTLEIDDDLGFQRKEWFAQRVGIGVMGLFVIAAMLGFTGMGGPLNYASAGERGDPIHVEYERVVRRGAKTTVKLHVHSDPPGFIQLWIAARYLDDVIIDSVAPIPQTVTVEASRHVYTVRAASSDVTITIEMEPQTFGRLAAEVGIVGGATLSFGQLSLF